MSTKGKVIAGVVVVVSVFLAGFFPQFLGKRSLQNELESLRSQLSTARHQMEIDEVRNLAGRMLLETSRKNFGVAGQHSTSYFNKLRELQNTVSDPSLKSSLSDLLALRDPVTSALAQGDPSILSQLQTLLERTYDLPSGGVVPR